MYLQVTQVAFLSLPIPNLIAMETRKNTGDKEFFNGACYFLGIFTATMMMIKLKEQRHREGRAH